MKKIFFLILFSLLTACATSSKNESSSSFDADFQTVFKSAMSTLKDQKFTIKNFDWNSGEIDAYKKYQDKDIHKELITTVAIEQQGKIIKVRMINKQGENSGKISNSDLNAAENAFFDALNKQFDVKQKRN